MWPAWLCGWSTEESTRRATTWSSYLIPLQLDPAFHLPVLRSSALVSRKRPSFTSTSASNTRPVFRDAAVKDLSIPVAIDAYNHYMGGVDIANQHRAAFTTLQHQNHHYWKPLFYGLLDIALTNSYLLARASR